MPQACEIASRRRLISSTGSGLERMSSRKRPPSLGLNMTPTWFRLMLLRRCLSGWSERKENEKLEKKQKRKNQKHQQLIL